MKTTWKKTASLAISLILTVILILPSGTAVFAENMPARVPIEELLAAGEYVEGEAVAIVRTNAKFSKLESEELSAVSSDAVEEAIDAADQSNLPQADAAKERLQNGAEEYKVEYFKDPDRTTKELLEELYRNPAVVAAEPNYVILPPEESIAGESAASESAAQEIPAQETGIYGNYENGDLTGMQWYLSDTEHRYSTPFSPEPIYMLNVPGWQEGRTDPSAPANASGTICVMDTGFDVNHPDLKNVLYEFTEEQQAKYNCGPNGINVSYVESEGGDPKDISDHNEHGSHVAGIIAAQWNEFGTSGIANGIRIFGARIFGDDGGASSSTSAIRAFQFLIKVAKEVNLKAVNCSWGNLIPQFILTTLVNELGKQGAVTVFASGNVSKDMDESPDSGPAITSVFCVNVNAASASGKKCVFSDYGLNSTDLFSSGDNIVSVAPGMILNRFPGGTIITRHYYERFYPELSAKDSLPYGVNTFADGTDGILVYDSNPALNPEAKELEKVKVSNEAGFDDKHSLAVHVQDLKELVVILDDDLHKTTRGFYLAIPVDSPDAVRWISAKTAVNGKYRTKHGFATLTFKNPEGKPVEIDHAADFAINAGYSCTSGSITYQEQWIPLSYNVKGFLDTVNTVHNMSDEERTKEFPVGFKYDDPGEVTGVYGWEKDGKTYLIAGFALSAEDPSGDPLGENTVLYLDDLALGNKDAWTGAYQTMCGTSMATPTVTASLAVIAKDEPESAGLSDKELEQMALSRVAKLLASVDYDDENLLPYCRTGGRLNLKNQTVFTKKAPLISRVDQEANTLKIEGYFFGEEKGSLTVDGTPFAAASWTDTCITADLTGLSNGSHTAMVTNADGARMQVVFPFSSDQSEGQMLYEKTLSLPVNDPDFINDQTDMIKGDMTALDGSVYVFTKNLRNECIALWRYRTEEGRWNRCADLPKAIRGSRVSGMAPWHGKLYVSSSRDNSYKPLWEYDPASDKWSQVQMELTQYGGSLCNLNGNLFYIPGSMARWHGESEEVRGAQISIIDPETKTVKKLKGDVKGNRYAGGSRYLYAMDREETGPTSPEESKKALLYRGTIDEEKGTVSFEDISYLVRDVFKGVLAEEIQICGIPGGIVMVGDSVEGTDTYMLMDSEKTLRPCPRKSTYHRLNYATAAVQGKDLYVIGANQTENDTFYFRSTELPVEIVPVTGVKLNKTSAKLVCGNSLQLKATVSPADATDRSVSWKSSNGKVLEVDSLGKVTAKAVGKATVTVTAADGKKSAKAVITVIPKGTAISRLKAAEKAVTVKWKKQAVQTTGYQIRCSTNKNFKTGTKTVTIRNNKTTQKTISGLKAKKTYYVQIRTYKKTGGKTYYSAWSKKKSVKTR